MHRNKTNISIAIKRGRNTPIAVRVRRPKWQEFIQY